MFFFVIQRNTITNIIRSHSTFVKMTKYGVFFHEISSNDVIRRQIIMPLPVSLEREESNRIIFHISENCKNK